MAPPGRLGRLLALSALVYLGLWTALPCLVGGPLGRDTVQIVFWGMEWQAGFHKHPPLVSWVSELALTLFGRHDGVLYATSALLALGAFAALFALAGRLLDRRGAVLAVLALPLSGYFSFIVPHLNHNVMLLPAWGLAILFAFLAIEEGRGWAWPALGVALGLGILAKYTILILPLLFLLHVLCEPGRRAVLADRRAWGAVALCLLVAGPNLAWVAAGGFAPLRYLSDGAGLADGAVPLDHLVAPLAAAGQVLGMAAPMLGALALAVGRPRCPRRPLDSRDRFLLWVALGPLGLVVLLAAATGGMMRLEWATPFLLPCPLLALRLWHDAPGAAGLRRFLPWGAGLTLAMAVTYVLVFTGRVPALDEARWSRFPAADLAGRVAAAWRGVCDGPLPVVVADSWLGGVVSHALAERPRVYVEADPRMAPWLDDRTVRAGGAVVLWEESGRATFRDLDHQEAPRPGQPLDWFPGLAALSSRFGPLVGTESVELRYPDRLGLAPLRIGLVLVPPATPCR